MTITMNANSTTKLLSWVDPSAVPLTEQLTRNLPQLCHVVNLKAVASVDFMQTFLSPSHSMTAFPR